MLSRGESKELGEASGYILANTFEAFIGALFFDQGMGPYCNQFIAANLLGQLEQIIEQELYKDTKWRTSRKNPRRY